MKPIVTFTVNPAIDAFCVADQILPVHKIRTRNERYAAGGGGLNVARVIETLGGDAVAFYLAGGHTGQALEGMVGSLGLTAVRVPIQGLTRVSLVVHEEKGGQEFRFTPEGPEVAESEWQHCLEVLSIVECEWFVASGSLARGMPEDFYAQLAARVRDNGGRMILDSSDEPLRRALEDGVHLIKPSLREIEHLVGRRAESPADEEALALELVRSGRAEIVALTLGDKGAVLATAAGTRRLAAPAVKVRSGVGAGDAFVGAMVLALARGEPAEGAFAWGVAAGTATAMSPDAFCRRADVERLHGELARQQS